MDCSLPGSSVHGIFQARVLEWGAIAFSTMEYYSAIKRNETIPLAIPWKQLDTIILSEISQKKKTYQMIPLICRIKTWLMNLLIK